MSAREPDARGDVVPLRRVTILTLVLLVSAGLSAVAQTPPRAESTDKAAPGAPNAAPATAPAAVAAPPAAPTAAPSESVGLRIEYLPGPDGRLVPVPDGPTLQGYLEWFLSQQQRSVPDSPEYGVSWVSLAGRADDERAVLEAVVRVQVLTDDEWVRIPLRFNEGILRDTSHKGPGEAQFEGLQRDAGYRCWLRGRGEHELKLSISVPVRKAAPGRRLQLSIPEAAGGSLRLNVPVPAARLSVSAQPADRPDLKVGPAEGGESTIEIFGLADRVDLAWQMLPDLKQIKPVLQVKTAAIVELPGESVLLNPVTQRVQALQGSFSELAVRLPRGFEVRQLLVDGRESTDRFKRAPDSEEVVIPLPEPTTGPVELRWILESEDDRRGDLTIEGFDVRDARLHTGEIVVEPAEGLTVTQRDGRDVHRTSIASSAAGLSERATAYRFWKQPFTLGLGVQEVEPYFTVTPRVFVRIGTRRAELFVDLDVEVYRGALKELALLWPNVQQEGWTLEPMQSPGPVGPVRVEPSGRVRVEFLQRRTGRFRVPLRASRAITVGAEPFHLTLPVPVASNRPRTVVVAAREDSVKLELQPAQGTAMEPIPARLSDEVEQLLGSPDLPEGFRELQRTGWLISSEGHTLHVQAAVHPQQILADTVSSAMWAGDHLEVEQEVQLEVDFRRLSQIRLLVPRELEGRVRFYEDQEETPLPARWSETDAQGLRQVRVTFAQPRIGAFKVVGRFTIGRSEDFRPGTESDLRIPLIHCADASYGSTRFVFRTSEALDAVLAGTAWKRQLSMDGSAEWITSEHPSAIPLRLRPLELHPAPELRIGRALIRSAFLNDGFARSRAQYRIDSTGETITVTLPPEELALETFWWDDQELGPDDWKEEPPGSGQYRVTVPESRSRSAEHLLTIDYRSRTAFPFHWSRAHHLVAPQFPPEVWVDQTVWEVSLPVGQHLFVAPEGFTPEFHWERETFFWGRRPDPEVADLAAWLGGGVGPERVSAGRGNVYQFSRFGPTPALEFRSMAQSLVVLCGAGLALAAGFVLLKVPATRSALTLLAAATALAIAGLWFTTPVQLLLQPAILGLLLAMAAAWIDGSLKRRRPAAFLTLSSPSDFTPLSSSFNRGEAAGLGSEDPTLLRPAPSSAREAASSTISGNHA